MLQFDIRNLTKNYCAGTEVVSAVSNVSFSAKRGDFISIAGHSGSGKTTLISIIGGLLRPTSGRVLFEGTDISTLNDNQLSEYRNRNISFIFQFASLLPALTATENVLLPCIFGSEKRPDMAARAQACLETVGLGEKVHAYPSQLSGGQQRRVAIARALINNPDVILADEPTGDLDEVTEKEIIQLFRGLNRDRGTTFIIVTHSLEIADSCNKKFIMSQSTLTGGYSECTRIGIKEVLPLSVSS